MVSQAAKTDHNQNTAAHQTTTIASLARQTEMTGGFKLNKNKRGVAA
jgi:hypothetical protein